jgi:hypothetical protein
VARVIVRAIRTGDPPGRFLRKDDKTGKWVDIGDKKAAEKTSQALREKTTEEKDRPPNSEPFTSPTVVLPAPTAGADVKTESKEETNGESEEIKKVENGDTKDDSKAEEEIKIEEETKKDSKKEGESKDEDAMEVDGDEKKMEAKTVEV